jgi:small-conductance mechanosensitive channel/CRP-like cAMP-binding protein
MNFWHNVELAAPHMEGILLWVVLIFIGGSLGLMALKPSERVRIRNGLFLFALSLVGLLLVATLASRGYGLSETYKWLRWASLICFCLALVNVGSVLLFEVILDPLRLKPPRIMRDLLLAAAYVVVVITLLSTIGEVNLSGIVATSAVLTAVIGLSFQDTLGNMMGGMALQLERTIAVGDWIRIDTQEGVVKEIRWRHTAIETRNWDTIIIPNTVLMKSQVLVLGRRRGLPRQHRQWVYFQVDFRYSPTEVIETVEAALRLEEIANIATSPAPNCVLMDFKESLASYAVRYWLTDLAVDDPTNSVVRTRIYFALRRAGIPLSIPAHSIFVTDDDQQRRDRKTTQEIGERVARLKYVELFRTLTEEERLELARSLRVAPFSRGEVMTRQGAKAHWLYVITKGEAAVEVSVAGVSESERIATLHAGDFFGEGGMMTGAPRAATVIALSDVECYRLSKEAFDDILRQRPEIAEDISRVMANRNVALEAARVDLSEEAKRALMERHQVDLLARIRSFFAL